MRISFPAAELGFVVAGQILLAKGDLAIAWLAAVEQLVGKADSLLKLKE